MSSIFCGHVSMNVTSASWLSFDQLPWLDDPTKAADVAVDVLAAYIDSADEEGDVPWVTAAMNFV